MTLTGRQTVRTPPSAEQEVRPADADAAGPPESSNGDGPRAQAVIAEARKLRRRRRRRWTVMVLVLALVLSAGWLLTSTIRTPVTRSGPAAPRSSPAATSLPPEMVVWKGFAIEVISSRDGHRIRALATGVALNRGLPHPTVSPRGIVYFDQGVAPPVGIPFEQIRSVPLLGGPATVVANGRDPTISPNGSLLAYVTDSSPEAIAVLDLDTGATKRWASSSVGPDITQLSWSTDSRFLAFTAVIPSSDRRTESLGNWALDVTAASGSLGTASRIRLPLCPIPDLWAPYGASRAMAWVGYLSPHEGIGACQQFGPSPQSGRIQLDLVDPTDGRLVARLPSLRGELGVANAFAGTESTVSIDASGRYLAVGEAGTGTGALYRWSIGQPRTAVAARPVLVTRGAFAASWVG